VGYMNGIQEEATAQAMVKEHSYGTLVHVVSKALHSMS
jgi:hypothetical protein